MKKRFFYGIAFAIVFTCAGLIACEETDDVCVAEASYDKYVSAVNKFSNNPTRSNCSAMKSAAIDYIEDATACGGYDISSVRSSINAIDCSVF